MNQLCKVCGEPAAGFHFGAFTCEGCKSFFGRTYNNLQTLNECKNQGRCVIDKKNRTSCKACRLKKCFVVGMSKSGSRYGRRSNWFKMHCLLQEQAAKHAGGGGGGGGGGPGEGQHRGLPFPGGFSFNALFNLHDGGLKVVDKDAFLPAPPSMLSAYASAPGGGGGPTALDPRAAAAAAAAAVDAAAASIHQSLLFPTPTYSPGGKVAAFSFVEGRLPFAAPAAFASWVSPVPRPPQEMEEGGRSKAHPPDLSPPHGDLGAGASPSSSPAAPAAAVAGKRAGGAGGSNGDFPMDLSLKTARGGGAAHFLCQPQASAMPLDLSRKEEIR